MTYLQLETNKEMSEREVKALYPNTSFPKPFKAPEGFAVLFPTPMPDVTELQTAYRDGVELDSKGNWVERWSVRDMFSDYTNEDDVVVTKAEQEAEYLAKKQADALNQAREEMVRAVESLIQGEITKYNEANLVAFKDIDACAKYTTTPTYTHYQFCVDVIAWQTNVWETARSIQADVLAGTRPLPTLEEFVAELPVFNTQG